MLSTISCSASRKTPARVACPMRTLTSSSVTSGPEDLRVPSSTRIPSVETLSTRTSGAATSERYRIGRETSDAIWSARVMATRFGTSSPITSVR